MVKNKTLGDLKVGKIKKKTLSRYEYVKTDFEVEDKLLPSTWIVVRINGRQFQKFSELHEFNKPNDVQALNLMNFCAEETLEEFNDIFLAYGFSDEYSFVLKKTSELYQRRASKITSMIVSFFSASYVRKWKEFFPHKDLRSASCFDARAICYPSTKILRDYLAWRQDECHIYNQYNTCLCMMVGRDISEEDATRILKGTEGDKNDFLFKECDTNYNTLPAIFRKGSIVFKEKVEEIVKFRENNDPVKRLQTKVLTEHCDIIGEKFWREHPSLITNNE